MVGRGGRAGRHDRAAPRAMRAGGGRGLDPCSTSRCVAVRGGAVGRARARRAARDARSCTTASCASAVELDERPPRSAGRGRGRRVGRAPSRGEAARARRADPARARRAAAAGPRPDQPRDRARAVVREGTVKYHVKNVLRKLGATSRADAVARYVRSGGGCRASPGPSRGRGPPRSSGAGPTIGGCRI